VNDDLGYPIVVERSVRAPLQRFLAERAGRFVVLCDASVAPLAARLTSSRARIGTIAFDLGEKRKRLRTVERVLEALLAAGADRGTTIVGVGGGVAADLFGLASALFMRGVDYVHVATTLVAMVDAAIGGKNGVDLPSGKNLAGTFRDPRAVFAHIDALQSLPYRHVREGLAETLKHAVIEGGDLFESLETLAPHPFSRWPWESLVLEALKVKTMTVKDDRMENGVRETLNLGHTFGHAIERASRYRVSHGAGVAIGLRAAGLLALRTGRFSQAEHLRVLAVLALLKLPLATYEQPGEVLAAMFADKKKREGSLRFVLPRSIGDVEYGVHAERRDVRAVLQRLTLPPGDDEFR
jgi:3-dehydroquinate synthetase